MLSWYHTPQVVHLVFSALLSASAVPHLCENLCFKDNECQYKILSNRMFIDKEHM